jgi:hypothetical protein
MCCYEEASWPHLPYFLPKKPATLASLLVCNSENKIIFVAQNMCSFIKTVFVIDTLFLFSFKQTFPNLQPLVGRATTS